MSLSTLGRRLLTLGSIRPSRFPTTPSNRSDCPSSTKLLLIPRDTVSFYLAEDKAGEVARIAGGWTGDWAGGVVGAGLGAGGAGVAGQLGPQVAIPEELITVPVCTFFGGLGGSIVGHNRGSVAGKNTMISFDPGSGGTNSAQSLHASLEDMEN